MQGLDSQGIVDRDAGLKLNPPAWMEEMPGPLPHERA